MEERLFSAFVNLGAVGLILWWLTLKLIPQLQQERHEAIQAFQQEMALERQVHRETVDKVVANNQRMIEVLQQNLTR